MTGPLLKLEKLEVVYHRVITAVQGISLEVPQGSVVVLLGNNGAGKTTVLRAIAGLYAPAHAVVRAGGETWTDTTAGTFVPSHRRHVGDPARWAGRRAPIR